MAKANLRIKEINKILSKSGNDSDSDDDLEDLDGLRTELAALQKSNADNQTKLDNYEKNKKWNVDNMCHVVEERTIVNKNVGESKFSSSGFALPKDEDVVKEEGKDTAAAAAADTNKTTSDAATKSNAVQAPTKEMAKAKVTDKTKPTTESTDTSKPQPQPDSPLNSVSVSMLSYHEFTEKYADIVEQFMAIESLDKSKEFLLQNGNILLQENASNYLLLASLEDEMNGFHEKMKLVARQSQIISNIAELAKSLQRHPGNVIVPFFQRLDNKELYDGFMEGVHGFIQRIEVRAVEKRKEIDEERMREAKEHGANGEDAVDVSTIPREERLGPGGLDPLEVFESLPVAMQEAFESREKSKLEEALLSMTQEEAEYHMKRCVDSGLWNA
jgi:cell division cycle protein 37